MVDEVEPWASFKGLPETSLQKIAGIMRATFGEDLKPVFGRAGEALATEIENYLSCQGDKPKKRRKVKSTEPEDKSVNQWEVEALKQFDANCSQHLGIRATIDWGRDRKLLRKLHESGHSQTLILTAVDRFFTLRDNPFIFRAGTIRDFYNSFVSLCKEAGIQEEGASTTTRKVPVGVK